MARESLIILRTSTDEVFGFGKGSRTNNSMETGEQTRKGLKRPKCTDNPQNGQENEDSRAAALEMDQSPERTRTCQSAELTMAIDQKQPTTNNQADAALLPKDKEAEESTSQNVDDDDDDEKHTHVPLHSSESEHETLEMVAALRYHHNRRVLLSRLEDTVPAGRLYSINLARRNLGPAEAKLVAAAMQTNPHLEVLKLCYNSLGDEGALIIAGGLQNSIGQHHAGLSILDLGFNGIGDLGCDAIAVVGVANNYSLRALYLTGNQIRECGAMSLARAILQGTGITSLYLSANTIGSTGMAAIAIAISRNDERLTSPEAYAISTEAPSRRMEHLHLSATLNEQEGFEAVAGLVLSTASLKTLCLSGNNIDDHDMVLLSHALAQNKSIPLESVRLGYNLITCQGVECFMNAVWGSPTLKEVMLNHNRLQDRGAQLCAVVLTSISLEILDLSFNRITTVGIKALMKNLSENTSLKSLSLCGIPVDLNASKAVSYALAYNSSLRELYLDNCSTGYSSQRHIVAGVVSNRRSSLLVLTGFAVGPVAMTLGMPQLPSRWTNAQVLRFFQAMWSQWLLKSGRGAALTDDASIRGPAPPAAVAAAAKIALAALGGSSDISVARSEHDKLMTERPPIDAARISILERNSAGSVVVPDFANDLNGDIDEWLDRKWQKDLFDETSSAASTARNHFDNAERRDRNLQWLRVHIRSLNEVGRLPFNNADLWQLHQYYFSPPFSTNTESASGSNGSDDGHGSLDESINLGSRTSESSANDGLTLGRAVSFQKLGDAFARSHLMPNTHKRRPQGEVESDEGPAAKKAKGLSKPRIAYYPRIMAKIQSLGTKPMELSLSLLRQLRYMENIIFTGRDPYTTPDAVDPNEQSHVDVEMILLDLL